MQKRGTDGILPLRSVDWRVYACSAATIFHPILSLGMKFHSDLGENLAEFIVWIPLNATTTPYLFRITTSIPPFHFPILISSKFRITASIDGKTVGAPQQHRETLHCIQIFRSETVLSCDFLLICFRGAFRARVKVACATRRVWNARQLYARLAVRRSAADARCLFHGIFKGTIVSRESTVFAFYQEQSVTRVNFATSLSGSVIKIRQAFTKYNEVGVLNNAATLQIVRNTYI